MARRFRFLTRFLVGVLFLSSAVARGNAQSTDAEIAARLINKPLFLRGSWGENKLQFDSTGRPAKNYRYTSFTTAGMHVGKVRLHNNRLEITGFRIGLEFNWAGDMVRVPLDSLVFIEINGAPGADFGPALDKIFATDLAEVPTACASYWRLYAAGRWLRATLPTPTGTVPGAAGQASETPLHVGGDVQPPRVLKQTDPVFSRVAHALHYSGRVQVGLMVEPDGTPSHVEIRHAAGMGLDEQAVAAVETYRFAPATQNGRPVPVAIYIEVHFQIS